VTEWENLGYRDSDMMGREANRDPRCFWQADLDAAAGRLVWLIRRHRPDVVTTYNEFGGYGHPDHIRTHDVAVRAFDRARDGAWYPEQLGGDGGVETWAPAKLYIQAIPASVRLRIRERMEAMGKPTFWSPPENATPDELAEFEANTARMLVTDESITTRIDVSEVLDQKFRALQRHVTQIGPDFPWIAIGLDGWREISTTETFILRESRVETVIPETNLFAGIG